MVSVRRGRPVGDEEPQPLVAVSVRLPVELAQALHRRAMAVGETKADIVRRALERELLGEEVRE